MAHPIFDRPTYPWGREEAEAFHKLLAKLETKSSDIKYLYDTSGDEEDLPGLTIPQPPHNLWLEALENLAKKGVLKTLVEKIAAKYPNNDELQKAVRDMINAQPGPKMRIISNKVVVLDRTKLQNYLEELESDEEGSMRVILVRGNPGSGRSHGRYRFFRTARDNGAKDVYLFSPDVSTVKEVIYELYNALDASSEIPKNFTTETAYYKRACGRLKELASSKDQRLWIAIDDLGYDSDGVPLQPEEIREFCDVFAMKMANPEFGRWFRLMLIDYPVGPVPTWWVDEIWGEDNPSHDDIQEKHVKEVLQTWLANHNRVLLEDNLLELVTDIIEKGQTPEAMDENSDTERLRRIHKALVDKLADLVEN